MESGSGALVTCVMPTADRRPFVARAIGLFLAQDYPDCELLIVDDGTDRVADLVPSLARVRYVALPARLVLGAKRNVACEDARGDVILHWDDDDWSAPWRVRYQVEQLRSAQADVCGLDRVLFYEPAAREGWQYVHPRGATPWVYGATLAYTKAFWRRNPFPTIAVGEDSRFVWANVPKRIHALEDNTFFVGMVHAGNTSRKETRGHRWHRHSSDAIERLLQPAGEEAVA